MAEQRIIDTRLGKRPVDADKILHFPQGLMGFEQCQEFTLLQIREGAPFLVLQSMNDAWLGLVVADPYSFLPEYPVKIGAVEKAILQCESEKELAVLVTVGIPAGNPQGTALNLTGPILINHTARLGVQVLQSDISPERVLLSECGKEQQNKKSGIQS